MNVVFAADQHLPR